MDVESLRKLEAYCEAFYTGACHGDQGTHDLLLRIASDTGSIPQLQAILAGSQNPYALIYASSSLLKLFSTSWNRITEQQKDDTRKFVLNYLYNQGPQLLSATPALLQNLVRLLARIVKLGWLESVRHQNITDQVGQFLQASTAHWIVGLTIYTTLTEDMQPEGRIQLARFRRTAMSFRETALSEIFRLAIQTLQQINEGAMHFVSVDDEFRLLRQVLHLCVNCLSFDFTGTMVDESNDDQPTVMIPYSWSILRETKIPELFFTFYKKCWMAASTSRLPWSDAARLCLQSLVLLSAIRRSFFQTEDDRKVHVSQLIDGTASIIEGRIGLSNDDCFHELCRLLGKINASNQLLDLSQSAGFQLWLDHVFELTINSLDNWKRLPNSQHYLVGVWSNMTGPLVFLKTTAPPAVVDYVKKVAIAFVDSRMRVADLVAMIRDGNVDDCDFEDPLSNEVMRTEQLAIIGSMGRFCHADLYTHLMRLFRENQEAIQKSQLSPQQFQQRAAWLVYFIGILIDAIQGISAMGSTVLERSWIRNRGTTSNSEQQKQADTKEQERVCTEMSQLVLALMRQTDAMVTAPEELELAYLFFIEHFRKAYITASTAQQKRQELVIDAMGEAAPQKLIEDQESCLGIGSSNDMFTLIATKLFYNLRCRIDSIAVVKKTLKVLSETVVGGIVICLPGCFSEVISSGQQMVECDVVKEILKDHQTSKLTFLYVPKYAKFRTSYYASLTNLVLLDTVDNFGAFLDQFSPRFAQLASAAASGEAVFATAEHRQLLITLARDFAGITAPTAATSYPILFSWLVNNPKVLGASRFEVFTRAVGIWWGDHEVMMPILKFVSEFVSNVRHRITFENNSPNGIYLVKTVLALFQEYGNRILHQTNFADPYRQKYKGIAWALRMVIGVLSGHFTNLGAFEAYNDSILSDVIILGLRLCLSIPVNELHSYTKQLAPYYSFVDHATSEFIHYVMQLEPDALTQLLESMQDVCSYDAEIVSSCNTSIGRIVKYYLTRKDQEGPEGDAIRLRLETNTPALKKLLNIIFQTIVGGEFYYNLSETLFYLIVLFNDEFNKIQEQLILQQIPERRTKLKWHFDDLMTNVSISLSDANKSQFSSNLYVFAGVVRSFA